MRLKGLKRKDRLYMFFGHQNRAQHVGRPLNGPSLFHAGSHK
jgi:hypothetical protein